MQAVERDKRRKSEQRILAAARELRGVRDVRYVHPLAEVQYQPGARQRAGSLSADRPATVGVGIARQRDALKHQGLYAESSSSYFPRINESQITREFREHRAKYSSSLVLPLSARRPSSRSERSTSNSGRRATARGRIETDTADQSSHRAERAPSEYNTISSVAMSLDKEGMEIIFTAFEELETLDEEKFVTEMLRALAAHAASEDQRVDMTSQVSELFRQADLSSKGFLTWQDFSAFFSQTSNVVSALEDTVINKYQGDDTPSPINFVAEIDGLIYLPEIDQVVIHDTKSKGFQCYDVQSCRIRATTAASEKQTRGRIVDAVYSNHGRYIVTASTSPVISFYDADQLQVRQQIPTESLQTALAIDYSAQANTKVFYSACAEGRVHAWDLETLKRRHTFFDKNSTSTTSGTAAMITDLEVLPATTLLACGSMDGKIYMVDVAAGRVSNTLSGHTKGVSMLQYCTENKYLVSGGIDHKLQVWNPHLEQKVGSLPGHRSQLIGLYVRPNSPEVITADESGVMKIWDLRKFAAVQTIVKELYVKNPSASTSRAMTAMCYIDSQQRIAVAHSTVYFLDPVRGNEGERRGSAVPQATGTKKHGLSSQLEQPEHAEETEEEEENKPLEVIFHPPTQSFVAITSWHIVCWEASTGSRIRSTPTTLGSEVTCVAVMEDLYSCFVGCDNGSVARLVLPNAAVVIHKPVHKSGEITALRLSMPQRRILSSGSDGNIIVSSWDTLEPVHLLNHWRGVNSVRSVSGVASRRLDDCYSVPLHLRPHFIGNEVERLKTAFAESDPEASGAIALSMLPRVLERVFPTTSSTASPPSSSPGSQEDRTLTFAMFAEVVQESLMHGIGTNKGLALSSVASFDLHAKLNLLVSTSSSDRGFCVWDLRNATVIGETLADAAKSPLAAEANGPSQPSKTRSIATVVFLHPLPYFICVEENSPRFTVWCSIAMPPLIPKPFQCVLTYTLTNAVELRSRASTIDLRSRSTFLTEPKPGTPVATAAKDLVARAIHWFFSERDDKKLLCVGDDLGQIHLLDLKGMFRRLEDLKKQAMKMENHGASDPHEERGRGSFSAAQSPVSPSRELLPPTVLQKLQRWSAHKQYGIGIRSVRVLDIENLIQPNANKRALVISVSDNGAVQLWSLDGQLLGRLRVTDSAESLRRRTWKLQVDVDELKQKTQESAMSMLKQVEQRASISMNQQEDSETNIATSMRELAKNPLLRRPTTESGARPNRSSPRSLRLANQPPHHHGSMVTTEDALVAWRRSVQVKQGRPSQPSIREAMTEEERG